MPAARVFYVAVFSGSGRSRHQAHHELRILLQKSEHVLSCQAARGILDSEFPPL
jgi:hypothetical protein